MGNETAKKLRSIVENVQKAFVGRREIVELAVSAMLADGHLLIVDLPGVGKTTLAKAIALSIRGDSKRLQFTPDLLPSDITGVNVYLPQSGEFEFHPGPVFTNIFLADEINRATPRAQSSLLEAMEERQVSTDGVTRPLSPPFLVIATQNPVEVQGTFPLPEAQLDRFLVSLSIGYPEPADELEIMEGRREADPLDAMQPVLTLEDVEAIKAERRKIFADEDIRKYILAILQATRNHEEILIGASPRAGLGMMRLAQARALMQERDYVRPEDVKKLAPSALGHRIIRRATGRLNLKENVALIDEILASIPLPAKR